jgi:hypothetical protein
MARVWFGCPHLEGAAREKTLRTLQVEVNVAPERLELQAM